MKTSHFPASAVALLLFAMAAATVVFSPAPASAKEGSFSDCYFGSTETRLEPCTALTRNTEEKPRNRAIGFIKVGDYWKVIIKDREKAERAYRNAWEVYATHCDAIWDGSPHSLAVEMYEQVAWGGDDARCAYELGRNYRKFEIHRDAVKAFTRSIEAGRQVFWSYYFRASEKFALDDIEGAIADADRAISIRQNVSAAYNNRGWYHFKNGDRAAAERDYRKALELDPGNGAAKENLAELGL